MSAGCRGSSLGLWSELQGRTSRGPWAIGRSQDNVSHEVCRTTDERDAIRACGESTPRHRDAVVEHLNGKDCSREVSDFETFQRRPVLSKKPATATSVF